jgi:L-lactate dehydrogenase complex protein LldG
VGDESHRPVVVDQFVAAARENRMTTHGPMSASDAGTVAVERAIDLAQGRAIAVPTTDPVLEALHVIEALRDRDASLLRADDERWRSSIGATGCGITSAELAAANTATMVISCGSGRPRGTHIVPPAHVCLVPVERILPTLEDALARVSDSPLPSNISWVSGPSRTADLEMRPTIGVHGPCTVEVVLVTD